MTDNYGIKMRQDVGWHYNEIEKKTIKSEIIYMEFCGHCDLAQHDDCTFIEPVKECPYKISYE